MTRALALRLLRRYPLAWRERYEAEVCALIEESSIRFKDLAELLRGLITERVRELISSTENPKRTLFVLASVKPTVGVVFVACATLTGLGLRSWLKPFLDTAGDTADVAAAGLGLAILCMSLGMLVRTQRRLLKSPGYLYPPALGLTLLAGFFVALMLLVATGVLTAQASDETRTTAGQLAAYSQYFYFVFYVTWTVDLLSAIWPGQRLLTAFTELSMAEAQVAAAQQWVAGCEEWIAKGVPSPLAAAEAQLQNRLSLRDRAQERLRLLDYRERFHHHTLKGADV